MFGLGRDSQECFVYLIGDKVLAHQTIFIDYKNNKKVKKVIFIKYPLNNVLFSHTRVRQD